eukprot:scaffold1618_cov158-Ochromonas_danica.AAC.11
MDLYRVLNVSRGASMQEIKTAYRKLAFKFHPDTCKNMSHAQAEEQFKWINSAYQTLSDNKKREEYDRLRGPELSRGRRPVQWNRPSQRSNAEMKKETNDEPIVIKYNLKEWFDAHYGQPRSPARAAPQGQSPHQRHYQRQQDMKERGKTSKKIMEELEEEDEEIPS